MTPLTTAARQAATLSETAHRPWPLPTRLWRLGQTWERLLFAHWQVPRERLQELVPGLPVDTFDGGAWLGITPFVLDGLRLVGTPPVPGLSRFPEANARTYVTLEGRPGIYFFSLDASSRLAVAAARRTFHLPYFHARMAVRQQGEGIHYESRRLGGPPAELRCRYRAVGPERTSAAGTLEHFLTERYCLYTVGPDGGVYRADIHHPPWPLRDAEAEFDVNTVTPDGLGLPDAAPLLHYATRQDTVVWPLERVARRL
jgi:uncharacterized protein